MGKHGEKVTSGDEQNIIKEDSKKKAEKAEKIESKELKQNRKALDGHEKDEEHLQMAESSYLELRDKFNFSYVICVKEHEIRDIEDINNEVLDIILK